MSATATSCEIVERIIAFVDLKGYHRLIASQFTEVELFNFLSDYYALVASIVGEQEGEVIKYLGDGALLLFPASDLTLAVDALKSIKERADLFLKSKGFETTMCVKAGIGSVAYGELGGGIDIVGRAVNDVALLTAGDFVLSDSLIKRMNP